MFIVLATPTVVHWQGPRYFLRIVHLGFVQPDAIMGDFEKAPSRASLGFLSIVAWISCAGFFPRKQFHRLYINISISMWHKS